MAGTSPAVTAGLTGPFRLPSRRLAEPPAEVVELVEIAEGDANLAVLAGVPNRHFGSEREAELVLKGSRVGVDRRGGLARPACLAGILTEALDVPDRQPLGDDAVGERVGVGDSEQGAGVSGRDLPSREQGARMFGQIGQPRGVGDVTAALADDAGDIAMRIAVVGAELGVARRFLECVEIGALDILDNGDFERLAVARLDDDDRDIVAPALCAARQRRSPAMIS